MTEAASAHILGSTGDIWAIIIVTVVSLAFFIAAVQIANIRQERDGRHATPAQRSGDAGRAARSHAGTGGPDSEEPGR